MKQSITKEQWNKLNVDEQKYFIDNCKTVLGVPIWESITIGRMIEYLGDDLIDIKQNNDCYGGYIIFFKKKHIIKTELADALWEACKYKLKK